MFLGLNKDQASVAVDHSEYNLDIDLAHKIQPKKSTFLKVLKIDGNRWTVFEGEDPVSLSFDKLRCDGASWFQGNLTKKLYERRKKNCFFYLFFSAVIS